jgi:hypothetical protein
MSPSTTVLCPGCNRPFTPGCSMSMHWYQSPHCRPYAVPAVNLSLPWCNPTHIQSTFNDEPCLQNMFPSSEFSDDDMNIDDLPFDVDDVLQDVAKFPQAYTNSQKHEAQLLKLIHSFGAPNSAFESIMAWAKNALDNDYNFQPYPLAYDRQVVHLEKLVGMTACRPSRVSVNMFRPDMEEDKLDVIVFDFPSMLASLFNCPLLNKLENLVVNPRDRFAKYNAPNGLLGEVNSGAWYDTAYTKLVKDPNKDFLCPIIFAMDKTVISEMAGLHVFVILFTSSVFNREVCTCHFLAL